MNSQFYESKRPIIYNSDIKNKIPNVPSNIIGLSGFIHPNKPIKWTRLRSDLLIQWLGNHDLDNEDLVLLSQSTLLKDDYELSCHLSKFLLCSSFYQKQEYRLSLNHILLESALKGPDFAKFLKDLRHFALRNGHNSIGLEPVPDEYVNYKTKSYDNILSERFLIHWEEECNDFFDYSFISVKEITKEDQDLFVDTCASLLYGINLDVDLDLVQKELNLHVSNTVGLDKNFHRYPNWKIDEKRSPSLTTKFVGERCIINVSPANCRDTVILEQDTRFTIQVLSRILRPICENIQYSAHIADNFKRASKIANFLKNKNLFFTRDIKKEGLTKPRILIRLVKRALDKVFPQYKHIWSYLLIYDNPEIRFQGKSYYPVRGHGLGMANELTTIIQSTIFSIFSNECKDRYIDVDAIFLNDDSSIAVQSNYSDGIDWDISEIERDIFLRFALIRNEKKSFFSKGYTVFLEEYFYYGSYIEKQQLYIAAVNCSLLCVNAAHCKEYISSLNNTDYLRDFLKRYIIPKFGYEFSELEIDLPITIGGWIPCNQNGLDYSLVHIDNIEDYSTLRILDPLINMIEKTQSFVFNRSKNLKKVFPPFMKKDIILQKDNIYLSQFYKVQGILQSRYPTAQEIISFWNVKKKKRYSEFRKSPLTRLPNKYYIFNRLINNFQFKKNFSIPESLVEECSENIQYSENSSYIEDIGFQYPMLSLYNYLIQNMIIQGKIIDNIPCTDYFYLVRTQNRYSRSCLIISDSILTDKPYFDQLYDKLIKGNLIKLYNYNQHVDHLRSICTDFNLAMFDYYSRTGTYISKLSSRISYPEQSEIGLFGKRIDNQLLYDFALYNMNFREICRFLKSIDDSYDDNDLLNSKDPVSVSESDNTDSESIFSDHSIDHIRQEFLNERTNISLDEPNSPDDYIDHQVRSLDYDPNDFTFKTATQRSDLPLEYKQSIPSDAREAYNKVLCYRIDEYLDGTRPDPIPIYDSILPILQKYNNTEEDIEMIKNYLYIDRDDFDGLGDEGLNFFDFDPG